MKFRTLANLLYLGAMMAVPPIASTQAQTVTWNRQALGQVEGYCTPGDTNSAWYWPNNANWSQTETFGVVCAGGPTVETAPSNWSTPDPPTNALNDVVLGNQGSPANLDLNVTINSLTFQTGGGLNLQAGTRISASAYNIQSDGAITIGGGGGTDPALSLFTGGTITKSGGTGTFTMDPKLVASMTNATITVASGTLALPGGSSFYTGGGVFNVANGATLNLVPTGENPSFSGTFTASGGGNVLFSGGNLYAGPGGRTFNAPGSMFQWTGGSLQTSATAALTNAGVITLSGGNLSGVGLFNAGTMTQSGGSGLNIQGSSGMNNLAGALFDLRNDAPITASGGGGANPFINNYGLFRKSQGTTNSINTRFNNQSGTIEVDTGALTLAGGGVCSNGTLVVSNSAILDLTGGNNPTWTGQINGHGTGHVLLQRGNLSAAAGGLTLNLPGSLFQWTGGDLQCSDTLVAPFTNAGAMTISGGRSVGAGFFNAGTMTQAGNGGLTVHGAINNLSSGLFDLRNDAPITTDVGGTINNYGLLRKSAGTNSAIEVDFHNLGGTIEVDTGTLALGSGISSNGTLVVSNAAVLDITGGVNPTWSGLITGTGAGEVLLGNGGTLGTGAGGLVLNLPGSLFQWNGGSLDCSQNPVTNSGTMIISGANAIGANFWNQGKMIQVGASGLNIEAGSGMNNVVGGIFDLQNDAPVTANGGGGSSPFIINYGLFRKSAGTSNSIVTPNLNNQGGTIEVESGILSLANNGSSSNALLVVSNAAILDLTGGQQPTWAGLITGQGNGQVSLQGGTLYAGAGGLTLNLPGSLFQWAGGTIQVGNNAPFTNGGTMNVSGGTVNGGSFFNAGTILQSGNGGLNIHNNSALNNLSGGVFDLKNDAAITAVGGGGNTGGIINYGLFRKSGGTSNSVVNPYFNNLGGTVEVDSGTLTLAGSGTTSNATLVVRNGAVLDITGGAQPVWAGLIAGQSNGQVLLQSGTLYPGAGGVAASFPGSMFQWTGGQIQVSDSLAAPFTNTGTLTVSGGREVGGSFFNSGNILFVSTNEFNIHGAINNLPGALFDLQSDGPLTEGSINNYGLLRKSAGTNVSTIGNVNNQNGDIEVDTGTIALTGGFPDNYVQGSGAFTVNLGGTNSGQFGQLQCNNATLSGPLNVRLTGSFTPAPGDQFMILTSSSLSGTFSALNVPQGTSVIYTNNNVVLVSTGSGAGPKIVNPVLSNGNLVFSFATLNGQSYTIQRNDDLATTNWFFYTNLNGNGSLMQVVSPVNKVPQRFFRLKQP